jgi:PAS domain S-box-containing protein
VRVKAHQGATPWRGSRRLNEHRRILQRQAALYEISEAAHQAEDLEALFRRLHAIVARLMPAENIYIALYDPATDLVSYPYYVDQVDAPPLGPEPLGRGLTSHVLRTGQPLLATAEVFERMLRAGEVESVGAPSLDWLGVPLRVRERTIGVMAIQTYSQDVRFGEAERDLLVYVSNHVAQAIERKRADWAIHESQRQLSTLMSNLPGMVYRCRNDASWTMELLSDGCQALTGYTQAQLLGNVTISYNDVVHPLDRERLHREVNEALAGERPYEFTYRIVTADGQIRWVWERGRGVFDPAGSLQALEGFIADVTAARDATEALRQSEERYRLALQATQEVMYDWDMVGGKLVWNRAVTRVLGWSLEEFGDTLDAWSGFINPEDVARVGAELDAAIASGEVFTSEYRFRRKSGDWAIILDRGLILHDETGKAVRMVGAMSDLTARRALEMQLQQAQRIEAVGQLAGGIAHDFNNLLTAILGSTELAQQLLPPDHLVLDELATIHRTAERAAELTRGLLAYARRQVLSSSELDLNEVISQAIPLLRRMIPENIDIRFTPDPGIGIVRGDRGQLTQILVNLCVNARDAMPNGGTIRVHTAAVGPGRSSGVSGPGGPAGRQVRLTVSDIGHGIATEDLPHVFEPFFTTKEVGQGTGLGLAVVYGVVTQHNGTIDVETVVGRGTTFSIHLPVAPGSSLRTPGRPSHVMSGGPETILVVEDEPEVRATLVQILSGLGYGVQQAADGLEALAILESASSRVDLVVTDVVMPRMGGKDLYATVSRWDNPPLFLFSSGYAEALVSQQLGGQGDLAFLSKPYGIQELAKKVREVLERSGTPGPS